MLRFNFHSNAITVAKLKNNIYSPNILKKKYSIKDKKIAKNKLGVYDISYILMA